MIHNSHSLHHLAPLRTPLSHSSSPMNRYMRVAHRTPDSERTSCPVGASCGEAGSEVGSIDGLADAGRGLRLCAVRGGLCARCCAVLSTCVAMSGCAEVGSSG